MRHPLHVLLLGAALALTGCGSAPTPPAASTPPAAAPAASRPTASTRAPTTTPTASPSPTRANPLVAKLPVAARADTRAGALAFARFYMTQVGARLADEAKVDLADLHASDCGGCDRMLELIDAATERGSARSNPMRISYVGVQFPKQDGFVIQVEWHLRSSLLYDARGDARGRLKGTLRFCRMDVVQRDGHWTVTEVVVERHGQP